MAETDDDIGTLERKIPALALKAFREAFKKAKRSGRPFVMVKDDELIEVQPDGSHKVLKKLPGKVKFSLNPKK